MANIRKRGNSYQITAYVGYDANGRQIKKYTTFTPPENISPKKADKLAEQFAYDFEAKCKGLASINENMRLSELTDWYFENYAPNQLKDITVYNYKSQLNNHVLSVLGNLRLKDITTAKLTEFYNSLQLNATTVRKIHIILSSVFTCGVKQGFIKETPCKNAILPKSIKKVKGFLSESQAKKLLEMTDEYSEFNTIIRVLLFTGMRSGECLGLRWQDVDFDERVIHIKHTLTNVGGKHFLTLPKTQKSARIIKMSEEVSGLLQQHKTRYNEKRLKLGEMFACPEMVFTSELGNYKDRSALNTSFRKFVNGSSFEHITLHDLRHCNATLLINSGIPLKIVSEHLGHSEIGITADIYAHVLESSKARVADALSLKLK